MKVFARAGAVKASLCLCGGHPVFARAAAVKASLCGGVPSVCKGCCCESMNCVGVWQVFARAAAHFVGV